MDLPIVVEVKGRDHIEVSSLEPFRMKIIVCEALFQKLQELKTQFGNDPRQWPLPKGNDHSSLLIQELILKLNNKWDHPYKHEEVCHCRNVSLETVEQAIFNGAHSSEMVSKWTMASTACGTCRPDVEKILAYRLNKPS